MGQCDLDDCKEVIDYLPFKCKYCGRTFCRAHRLPENHKCSFEIRNKQAPLAIAKEAQDQKIINEIPYKSTDNIDTNPLPKKKYYTSTERPQRTYSNHISQNRSPFFYPSSKITATYSIIGLNILFFIFDIFFWNFLRINVLTLRENLYIWTLFTALFVPDDPITLIFSILIFYSMGKIIETRYGPKFLVSLYILLGISTEIIILLIQSLGYLGGFFTPSQGIFLGFIALWIYIAGFETRLNFLLFFIPMNFKAKYILYFLIIYNLIFGIIGIILSDIELIVYLANLIVIPVAKLAHNTIKHRMTQQWY